MYKINGNRPYLIDFEFVFGHMFMLQRDCGSPALHYQTGSLHWTSQGEQRKQMILKSSCNNFCQPRQIVFGPT